MTIQPMYICMYVLALGLPPGGITCPYLTLSGAHVPRGSQITSTRGNRDPGGPASALGNSGAMTTTCNYLATTHIHLAIQPMLFWTCGHHVSLHVVMHVACRIIMRAI
jgi:hypothetical protein